MTCHQPHNDGVDAKEQEHLFCFTTANKERAKAILTFQKQGVVYFYHN